MFRNVVVGVNGGDGTEDAIALAVRLLAETGELTLAHVYSGGPGTWRGASAAYELDQSRSARELLERAGERAGVRARLRWLAAGSVGRGLHELAEGADADLLVIGSSRRGLIGRVLIGDDTRESLNGAPCAVAVAPAGYSRLPGEICRIGVGYDGSPESENALAVARVLAAEHHSRLSAMHAVAYPTYLFTEPMPPDEEALEDLVEEALERLEALEGVEPQAVYGHAAEELALYSTSLDLLVLGSRGYGPIGRLVHGSTSRQLARTARCPLLVLTRGARVSDAEPAVDRDRAAGVA